MYKNNKHYILKIVVFSGIIASFFSENGNKTAVAVSSEHHTDCCFVNCFVLNLKKNDCYLEQDGSTSHITTLSCFQVDSSHIMVT